jgi:hypothetical protein
MDMMQTIVSHYIHNWNKANHKCQMLVRAKVLGRTKNGSTTKLVQGQSNTMEVKFAQLETLITIMVAHVNLLHLGQGMQKIKRMVNLLLWIQTQDIFVEATFQDQWPLMRIC